MTSSRATAVAHANIALVKYWGKRDRALNLPARGSLSLTLSALRTVTEVQFGSDKDSFELDGAPADATATAAVVTFLDRVRAMAGSSARARVTSRNEFPTAAGLASSASGYAALAVAATHALGLSLTPRELSVLARLGSGSAARSIFGGLVRMHAGTQPDGSDAFAEPVPAPAIASWVMVIAVVGGGAPKAFSSRDAMNHCAATSPFYDAWLDTVTRDLTAASDAAAASDLPALGAIVEGNAMAMHASAIASRPSVIFWQGASLAALACVRELRQEGVAAWATMDAGPHVKVLTTQAEAPRVAAALAACPGVTSTLIATAGPAAHLVSG